MALQYWPLYFGLLVLLVFVVAIIGAAVACGREVCKREERKTRVSHIQRRPALSKRAAQRTSSRTQPMEVQLAMCTECEATILADAKGCPHCGRPRPVCIVCSSMITHVDSVLSCPHCNGRAHRIHFLEYIKVKGACPYCRVDLDSQDLVDPAQRSLSSTAHIAPQHLCMVCRGAIGISDDVLQCPKCRGKAHRIHILEYIKVKGTCPHCHAELDSRDFLVP